MTRGAIARRPGRTAAAGSGLAGAAGLVAALVTGWPALAQDAPPRLAFDVSTTFNADSNRTLSVTAPQADARLDTRLGFTFDSRTRTDQLQLSASGLLRLTTQQTGTTTQSGLQDPRLRFAYARDTGNARLSANASFTVADVNLNDVFLLPDGTLGGTIPRAGSVTNSAAGLSVQTGVNDPIGFLLTASASSRAYSDTTDPNVFDSRRASLRFTTRLTPSPRTRIDLNLAYALSEDDNATGVRRNDRSVSVRLDQALSPLLTLQTEIGYSQNTRDETILGLPVRTEAQGLFGQIGLSLQRPNGTVSLTFASQRDTVGPRNSLRLGRSLDLASGGTLAAEVGLTGRPGGQTYVIGSLRYSDPLPTGRIEARVERSVTLDANNADVTATRVGVSYAHEINDLSRFNLSADFGQTSTAAAVPNDVTSRSFRATYSRALTPDWNLETGYQYRDRQDNAGLASSNSVFLTVGRRFTAWP